jgi:hypothetical protein
MVFISVIEVRGPGHHERSEFAGRVVNLISSLGFKVAVEADLRPRLAADLTEMLEQGAKEVLLYASGMMAKVVPGPELASRADLEPLHDDDVDFIVRLVPSDGSIRVRIVSVASPELEVTIIGAFEQASITLENP